MALAYGVGARVRRREDPRLVSGSGAYLDDVQLPKLCHATFIRSYLPHAVVRSVDVAAAQRGTGILAVFTAADLKKLPSFPQSGPKGSTLPRRPLLNDEKVCFAGDLIAIVVAETRDEARDATELVSVDLEALPALVDPMTALREGATVIHRDLVSNVADRSTRVWGDIDGAFSNAPVVVRSRIRNQRVAGVPIETRG